MDSDVLIEIFEKNSELGRQAFSKINDSLEEFATTSISIHEVLYGLKKQGRKADYVTALPIIDYTRADALLSSVLEYKAGSKGKKVNRPDAMIAAIAINKRAKLYTYNTDHFKAFESLDLVLF